MKPSTAARVNQRFLESLKNNKVMHKLGCESYAGRFKINTPTGAIYSNKITQDKKTGKQTRVKHPN